MEACADSIRPVVGTSLNTFELNSTFTEAPSPETDTGWNELVPGQAAGT